MLEFSCILVESKDLARSKDHVKAIELAGPVTMTLHLDITTCKRINKKKVISISKSMELI